MNNMELENRAQYLRGRADFATIIEAYKEAGLTPPLERDEPGWWKKKVVYRNYNKVDNKNRGGK
jgi:hypothetical protein